MSLAYLLDTNVVSEPLRPNPDPHIINRLEQYQDVMAIAPIVWHKLVFGARRLPESKKRSAIEAYLNEVVIPALPILAYDSRAATWHAAERARLTGLGQTPPFIDGQIAAIAKTNNLALVTLYMADYAGFQDLQIENWAVPE